MSYEYPGDYRGHVYAQADAAGEGGVNVNLLNINFPALAEQFAGAHFMYLWMP